jgi:hypothetical protein
MKMEIGAYVTIITAIIAAYLYYRNQLRLKAFELFLARRDSVLRDVENFIAKLYLIQNELDSASAEFSNYNRYIKEYYHEGLILYHKVKGANFSGVVSVMIESFWSIIQEDIHKSDMNPIDWIRRTLNILSALYGFAYSQVTKEIESVAFSPLNKLRRQYLGRITTEEKE